MRFLKTLVLPAALVAALAGPAAAPGAVSVGISENNPEMFTDPLFTPLGVKQARVVVSYNVVEASLKGDNEIQRVDRYIRAALAAGVEPLVTFEHSRGAAEVCKSKSAQRSQAVCHLPTPFEYESAFKAFRQRFPSVKTFIAFNEGNHFTQATSRNPKAAAQFAKIAERNCAGCKILPLDVLDQADKVKAKKPTFKATTKWIKAFRKAYGKKPKICGIHNYSDTNRFRDAGTKALIKAMGCKEYWLTETGGLYNFGSFWSASTRKGCSSAEDCQLKATRYLFNSLVRKNKKIKRLYVYTWFGAVTPRFDAGLVADGKPRKAYAEVAKRA
jgi:hypothetical protein